MDSTPFVESHRKIVYGLADKFVISLIEQAIFHDVSKLESPEKEQFDKVIGERDKHPYGSPEYNANIAVLGDALKHHYANNSHHPEHYKDGIKGMTLLDLVMMFIDASAAVEENEKGDMCRSIHLMSERFDMGPQLTAIFENTIKWYRENK